MASASSSRTHGAAARIKSAASTLFSDNQSLVTDIAKTVSLLKEIAVDFEKDNQTQKVKELENAAVELVETFENCVHLSSALQNVGSQYQTGQERTNFKKLFDNEIMKLKASSSSERNNHALLWQFKEAVWNVHHAGQPMPGEEQEEIVMTHTQCNLLNVQCPITGKPVTELAEPVRSVECKHIYEKSAILQYIKSKCYRIQCPVSGCPKILEAGKVMCDPLLPVEIEEVRKRTEQTTAPDEVQDFTMFEEECISG